MQCPCGSNKPYTDCCEPYHQGAAAPTPEALMRSRYSAFVVKNVDYLAKTMRKPASLRFNVEDAKLWVEQIHWQGLTVFTSKLKKPTLGYVSFDAVYSQRGKIHHICEKSEFHLIDGQWFYVDGKSMNPAGRDKT